MKGNWVCQAGLSHGEPVLVVNNTCIGFQVSFQNSQNNLLHYSAKHSMDTDRPVVTKVTPLALIEDWDICQFLIAWNHLDPLHPWKTHWEKFHNDSARSLSTLGWKLPGLIDLKGANWSSKPNPSLGLGCHGCPAQGLGGVPKLIISVEDQGKDSIKYLCPDFVPVCEVIILIMCQANVISWLHFAINILLIWYFDCPPQPKLLSLPKIEATWD